MIAAVKGHVLAQKGRCGVAVCGRLVRKLDLRDHETGKRALELILAIYQSAAEQRPVRLPLEKCSTMDFAGRFGEGEIR